VSGLHVACGGPADSRRSPVVLLHGWGMNGEVWGDFAALLAADRAVHRVDLPGHGRSPWPGGRTLDQWAGAVRAAVPPGAVWVAWSLGVAVALRAALAGDTAVRALVAIAGTPRFLSAGDWPHAVDPQVLRQFGADLGADPRRTVERFLGLQVRGARGAAATLRRLRGALREVPPPHPEALGAGLDLLAGTDLRARLHALRQPAFWLLGEKDTLVPSAMGWELARWLPGARVATVAGAGHAPFLSHPDVLASRIRPFLEACDG
jgi:pimeloyl-[acyl-carrier protein] methyl ester esterase